MFKNFVSTRFVVAVLAMLLSVWMNLAGHLDGGQVTTIFVTALSLFGLTKSVEYLRGGRNGNT